MNLSGLDVADKIQLEFHELLRNNKPIPEDIWRSVPLNLYACIEKKNPNYAFIVIALCNKHGFTPTKTMSEVFAQASIWQLNDEGLGTVDQIKRAGRKDFHRLCVAHLLAVGNTLEQACRKTAMLSLLQYPREKPIKASTIEKEHQKQNKKDGLLRSLDEHVKRLHENVWDPARMPLPDDVQAGELVNPKLSAEWRAISESIPDCFEWLIGNTRD